jgi:hypothetical protein
MTHEEKVIRCEAMLDVLRRALFTEDARLSLVVRERDGVRFVITRDDLALVEATVRNCLGAP